MKTKDLFLGMAVFLFVFGLTSCDSNGTNDGESSPRAAVEFRTELTGNPTTGYSWVCSITPEGIVRELSNEYIPDPVEPGVVGSGGKFVFTFEAIKEGEAELVFSYLRPWELNVPALRTETYYAKVDGKGNLTIARK